MKKNGQKVLKFKKKIVFFPGPMDEPQGQHNIFPFSTSYPLRGGGQIFNDDIIMMY